MRKKYHWFCKKVSNKYHSLLVNGTLLSLALYFSLQKLTPISLDDYLASFLKPEGYSLLKQSLIFLVVYSSIVKLVAIFIEYIPSEFSKSQEPEKINECILVINEEIKRHLREFRDNPSNAVQTFTKSHNFEVNIAHIVSSLADHLKRAFPTLKVKNRDVFISVYSVNKSQTLFNYITHWNPTRDVVISKEIDISKRKFKAYECVKALATNSVTIVKFDCSQYAKSKGNRGKIKHYIGFRVEDCGVTMGFVNIEFHNQFYFPDEDSMIDFVEKEIIVFKYLVEYQFLKKSFFATVESNLIQEVAA